MDKNLSKAGAEGYYYHDGMKMSHSRFNLDWCNELGILPKVVFDIGSCDCGDGWRFKERFNCEVYSFEASPERYKICKEHGDKLGLNVYHYGIHSYVGQQLFYPSFDNIQNTSGAQGSFFKHTDKYKNKFKHIQQLEPVSIPITSVGHFCKINNIETIDVAHIDVEGAELFVVQGFENIRPKLVFLETLGNNLFQFVPTEENLHKQMLKLNYELLWNGGADKLYAHRTS